jgi:hypothetical protein
MRAPAHGAMSRVLSPMTSSMITLVMSGTSAMTAIPASEEPSASTTSFGYRHAYPASRRAQPLVSPCCAATPMPPEILVRRKAPTRSEPDFIPPQWPEANQRRYRP